MTTIFPIELSGPPIPLSLSVEREAVGGIEGLAPTVAIREASTLNSYLDFSDNVFKTSGWALKYGPLVEVGRGLYQRVWDYTAVAFALGKVLSAEYRVVDGSSIGDDFDLLVVGRSAEYINMLREALTNRLEQNPGNPGQLILYQDDGVTPRMTWSVTDSNGGAILPGAGVPMKRGAGT